MGIIDIGSNIETSEIEKQEWDEESWIINTGIFYTKINNSEYFELNLFWEKFIKYIKNN